MVEPGDVRRFEERFGKVERPDQSLLTYYVLSSFVLGPFFFFMLIPRAIRFRTLQYVFDEHGVTARWGFLFRREVHVGYNRIQDIHLSSGVLERWLELARIQVQTASGSSEAELTLEGFKDFEDVRDLLYAKMREAHGDDTGRSRTPAAPPSDPALATALGEAAAELRRIREILEQGGLPRPGGAE